MDMMLKITGLAISVVVLAVVLKKGAKEQAFLLVLAFSVIIFFFLGEALSEILETMNNLAEMAQIDQALLNPVIKTVAISVTSKITCELCRSAGEGGIATMVEFSAVVLSLVIAFPLLEGVMSMMSEML